MTRRDIVGLIILYVYAFGLLLGVEAVGRRLRWPQYLTRKLVHIGAGMWIWGILALFESWIVGIIPFATFIVLNYLFYRTQLFKTMDAAGFSPGTVYFAISITALFALLWRPQGPVDRAAVAAAAVMAMTWGDGVASIVGQRWGRRMYQVLDARRSWEGTAAMAAFAFASVLLTLLLLPGSALSPTSSRLAATTALGMTAVAEGISPAGTDNLSVPLLTGVALALFTL